MVDVCEKRQMGNTYTYLGVVHKYREGVAKRGTREGQIEKGRITNPQSAYYLRGRTGLVFHYTGVDDL
jgi:hypothetical protein